MSPEDARKSPFWDATEVELSGQPGDQSLTVCVGTTVKLNQDDPTTIEILRFLTIEAENALPQLYGVLAVKIAELSAKGEGKI